MKTASGHPGGVCENGLFVLLRPDGVHREGGF